MSFNLIVPSKLETQTTGFVMGATKTIYKQNWAIRLNSRDGQVSPVVTKNDKRVIIDEAVKSKSFLKFWNDFISFYNKQGALK